MLSSESSSRIWIDTTCGLRLLPINHESTKHNRRRRTSQSAVGFRRFSHIGEFFWWIEGERWLINKDHVGEQILDLVLGVGWLRVL